MPKQIQVLRETLVKQLSSIKEDNVSIAGIAIERRKLLEALRLQTQEGADVMTINYGNVSWHYDYKQDSDGEWEYSPVDFGPQACIQISCNHTTMRFLNHAKPTHKNGSFSNPAIPLNFVDYQAEVAKPELTGIPVDTEELIKALTFVQHGVETNGEREVLECFLFDCGDDAIKLVTADGFRLPIAKMQAKGIPKDKVLIHRDNIPKLLAYLKANTKGKGKSKYWLDTYLDFTGKTAKFSSEMGG